MRQDESQLELLSQLSNRRRAPIDRLNLWQQDRLDQVYVVITGNYKMPVDSGEFAIRLVKELIVRRLKTRQMEAEIQLQFH